MGRKKKISANIILLGIVSLLNDLSSEMIVPILPMFITALGGGGVVIGFIGGLRDSIHHILQVVFGYFSDKTKKRKVFVFSGYLLSAVFKLFLAFSKAWHHVLIFSGLERVGKGVRDAPRDAIISECMPKRRGESFGIHRAFDTSGAVLGSIAVFLLFWFMGFSFKLIILIAAVLSFLTLIPLHFVKEKKLAAPKIALKVGEGKLSRPLKLFLLVSSVFAFANFSYMFFILRAQHYFSGKLAIGAPILLYILYNIFYALFAIPFGNLSDRIGREKVIFLGYALFLLTTLGFALFDSLWMMVLLFMLYGVFYAAVEGNQRALVSDLSSCDIRGTALGTFHTLIGIVKLPGSLIAGLLWYINPTFTFLYGSVVSLISLILFIVFRRHFAETIIS